MTLSRGGRGVAVVKDSLLKEVDDVSGNTNGKDRGHKDGRAYQEDGDDFVWNS